MQKNKEIEKERERESANKRTNREGLTDIIVLWFKRCLDVSFLFGRIAVSHLTSNWGSRRYF